MARLILSFLILAASVLMTMSASTYSSIFTFANAEEPFQSYPHIQCEACLAITEEIGIKMNETNKVKTSVQSSHRLEGGNERRIDYESSELRAVEILDGLCNTFFNSYFLRFNETTEKRYFGKDKAIKRAPFYGKPDKAILGAPSRKLQQFCAAMMDENDNVVTKAIMKQRTLDDLQHAVCYKGWKTCANTKAIEKSLAKEAKYKAAHHKLKEKKRIKKLAAERKKAEEEAKLAAEEEAANGGDKAAAAADNTDKAASGELASTTEPTIASAATEEL